MKKIIVMGLACLGLASSVKAQTNPDDLYVRNSLFMMKLDMPADNDEYKHAFDVMNKTFNGIDFAKRYERYNDFALKSRHIDWAKVPTVTNEEMDAVEKESKKDLMLKEALTTMGIKVDPISEREYAARLLKYFTQQKTANQLVAKWHIPQGADPAAVKAWDNNIGVIMDLGMKGLSEEARSNAIATQNLNNVCGQQEIKLMNTTYVCVNNFRMLTAEEKSATAIALAQVAVEYLPGPAKIAGKAAVKAAELAAANTKGYFVKANAYLFKLDWDQEKFDKFYSDHWKAPAKFNTTANYTLTYVGKSAKTAGAGLTMSAAKVDELTARGCLRATDAAIAALQRDHEEFRPMTSLHVIDGKLAAYIGQKESIKDGDKFDVFSPVENENGTVEWKKVGSVKVAKKGVWDNREGAGKTIEGAAVDGAEKIEGNNIEYTVFDGKPGKLGEGCMIRLAK